MAKMQGNPILALKRVLWGYIGTVLSVTRRLTKCRPSRVPHGTLDANAGGDDDHGRKRNQCHFSSKLAKDFKNGTAGSQFGVFGVVEAIKVILAFRILPSFSLV